MQCPFPGMDPYIERPEIWPDFHDRLVTEICGELQPMLRPKYAALVQDRLYVVESQRSIYPDVAVVEPISRRDSFGGGAAMLELEEPVVFETMEEEIRVPYLEIIEPKAGNRLITAIEVLSPANKSPGIGREQYLQKRREVQAARAGLVEIDLLRAGKSPFQLSAEDLAKLRTWRYLVGVSRRPKHLAVYAIALEKRLPSIKVPLANGDPDVTLDLQAAFNLVWQKGPYPTLLNYDGPPPGEMTPDEIAWCEQQVRLAGFRSAAPTQ